MLKLTEENFNEIIKSDKPVLVDFWADWCGPCRMLAPVIEELAGEYGENAVIGKVNVDEEAALSAEYAVVSIPTVIVFKDGKPTEKLVGVRAADEYRDILDNLI